MAKPGAMPRSVIILVVFLLQFSSQILKSASAARYSPAVVSHGESGRTAGASFVPNDSGAAGLKLERRLSDDSEETNGAAYEGAVNEVKTTGKPPGSHGHHPCPGNGGDGRSGSGSRGGKGGDGGGCGGGRGGDGGGPGSPGGDGADGGSGGDGGDGGDGGWAKPTEAGRSQKFSVSEGKPKGNKDGTNGGWGTPPESSGGLNNPPVLPGNQFGNGTPSGGSFIPPVPQLPTIPNIPPMPNFPPIPGTPMGGGGGGGGGTGSQSGGGGGGGSGNICFGFCSGQGGGGNGGGGRGRGRGGGGRGRGRGRGPP